jgi:hypothetical protein
MIKLLINIRSFLYFSLLESFDILIKQISTQNDLFITGFFIMLNIEKVVHQPEMILTFGQAPLLFT